MLARRVSRAAVADVYEDVYDLIQHVVGVFCRRYPNWEDPDDVEAWATLLFLEGYHTHDPSRGELRPRLWAYIWGGLCDRMRSAARRAKNLPRVPMTKVQPITKPQELFEIGDLYLSDDARIVVEMLLREEPGLDDSIRKLENPKKPSLCVCLRNHLSVNLGWDDERISEAFRELREVLK